MAIPGMSGASPMESSSSISPSTAPEPTPEPLFSGDGFDEIDRDNYNRGQQAKASAEKFIAENTNNITFTGKWFSPDYIIYTPPKGSKMTYGQLREKLGIPPGLLSEENNIKPQTEEDRKKKSRDDYVISGPVKVTVDQIGWYEKRMTTMERDVAKGFADHGDKYAYYDRNYLESSEVSEMIKEKLAHKKK